MAISASANSRARSTARRPRRAMALATVLALAALSAGCAGTPSDDGGNIAWSEPGAASATGSVSPGATAPNQPSPGGPPLDWRTALAGDTVVVEFHDRNDFYRVERVELVGPNALTVASYEINRQTSRASGDRYGSFGGPSLGVGVGSWGGGRRSGSSVGLGLGFPLGGGSSRSDPPTGTMTSARVRIPDPALYRETAGSWVLRVTFSDRGGQPSSAVLPAPKPAA